MNKPKDEPGLQTILSHCGRNLEASGGYVNVPPYEGSTILHDDMEDLFGLSITICTATVLHRPTGRTEARRMKLFMTP